MVAKFNPERLKSIRENLGLNKAEAARLIGITPIGYLRYEQGVRTPAAPIIEQIAMRLQTSSRYLTGLTRDPSPEIIYVSKYDEETLFELISQLKKEPDDEAAMTLLDYYKGHICA